MAVGTTGVGADVVGRRKRSMGCREISDMAGGAGVRVAEAWVEMSITKGEAGRGQGVIAGGRSGVAVSTGSFVCCADWLNACCLMARAGHATWAGGDIARRCVVHVLGRGQLVLMTVQAVSWVGTEGNYVRDRGAGAESRVDIPGRIVTLAAIIKMGQQDVWPVAGMVAVGAGLAIGLTKVGQRIDINGMVNQATG